MNLKNKICLLTGATGGLGTQIIKSLILENVKLVIIGKSKKKLITLKQKFNKNILDFYESDFSNQDNIISTINQIRSKKYQISILINSSGVFRVNKFHKFSEKEIIEMININLIAPIFFTKEFSKIMKKNNWGRIVNIGSSSSYEGFAGSAIYCTTKHALLGFSRSINEEFKLYGVRSYIFSPGSIKTRMGKSVKNQNYGNFIDPLELAKFIVNVIKQNNNMITEEIKINRIKYT